jgi:predicted AlkP superfamily phosphohydrolase/phosphomutase
LALPQLKPLRKRLEIGIDRLDKREMREESKMSNRPKKVAVIGLDCAILSLVEKHVKAGKLPTFKKLFDSGVVAENCLCPYPTITPPNWASIATGAWPGTHCVTDFHRHTPGTTPSNVNIVQNFSSDQVKAELMWDAADKAGKKCIVLNYPGSWPSHMKNGIMVGGAGMTAGDFRDGLPFMQHHEMICADMLITTGIYPNAIKGAFRPATGWQNIPKGAEDPMEMEVKMVFRDVLKPPADTTWHVLVYKLADGGYSHAALSPTKNGKDAFCKLSVGQWSANINARIKMQDGTEQDAIFRCKLIDLSEERDEFRLYVSAIGTTSGWSNPPEIAGEIHSENGIIAHVGGVFGFRAEWYEMDTFVEIQELYTQWLADAASTLMKKHEWDMFFMHVHSPDWTYHLALTDMNLDPAKDKKKYDAAWEAHLRVYQAQDRLIAQILKETDEDTLIIVVSDHGAVADGAEFNPHRPLCDAGLTAKMEEVDLGGLVGKRFGENAKMAAGMILTPDASKSQALAERTVYVYVNLKGRDPEGIVEPADYEKVQRQICDALLSYVDPATGRRPVALALCKKDARVLGLHGDAIGDVVYALYPEYSGQHGNILPGTTWGCGDLKPLLSFTGPGIKKGQRMQRTCNLVDIVPTLCYLMDLPLPAQAEGSVLYHALSDPNVLTSTITGLQSELQRIEGKLQNK